MDSSIRRRKTLGDLWDARIGVSFAMLAVGCGSIWLRLQPGGGFDVWPLAVLLSLLVIGQAAVPLARARAAELTALRALGADDRAPAVFALLEGGGLGALAGCVALVLGPGLGHSLIWLGLAVCVGGATAWLTAQRALRAGRP